MYTHTLKRFKFHSHRYPHVIPMFHLLTEARAHI